ncbi:hypothetical protein HNP99_002926 [Flavobacterium sp. 28A]|nr:hypothetical protein [Flavobacterium sp. 28A]NRT16559.1 hypothetical protein [Flavobacterium sp. 28A]
MKTKIYILLIVFSFSQMAISQNILEGIGSEKTSSLSDFSKEMRFHLISQINFKNEKNNLQKDYYQNENLNINQIGSYNSINVKISAKVLALDVLQKGDENRLQLDKQVNDLKQKVIQEGQNNTIKDISLYRTSNDVNTEFIQKGNNQTIHNYGENSISKDMKVIQKGDGAAVFIFNHK